MLPFEAHSNRAALTIRSALTLGIAIPLCAFSIVTLRDSLFFVSVMLAFLGIPLAFLGVRYVCMSLLKGPALRITSEGVFIHGLTDGTIIWSGVYGIDPPLPADEAPRSHHIIVGGVLFLASLLTPNTADTGHALLRWLPTGPFLGFKIKQQELGSLPLWPLFRFATMGGHNRARIDCGVLDKSIHEIGAALRYGKNEHWQRGGIRPPAL